MEKCSLARSPAIQRGRRGSAVGRISRWIGLPKYEAEIPKLQTQAEVCSGLAIALPFIAALLLGLGVPRSASSADSSMLSYPVESPRWSGTSFV